MGVVEEKSIKNMPWPSPWKDQNTLLTCRIDIKCPVVNGKRLLVATFLYNRNCRRFEPVEDFRLVASKADRDMAILRRGSSRGAVKTLREQMPGVGYCCPSISTKEEGILLRWLGCNAGRRTGNHGIDLLAEWTDDVKEEIVRRRRQERGELADDDYGLCPDELPAGLVEYIRGHILPADKTLVYKRGNTRGTCFACGRRVLANEERFRQGYEVKCPSCGETVHCVLEGGSAFSAENVENVATIQLGIDGATLFIRQWRLLRPSSRRFLWENTAECLKETARYAVRGRHAAKWQKEVKEQNGFFHFSRVDLSYWQRQKNVCDVYDYHYYFYLPQNWRDIVAPTSSKYISLDEYPADKNPIRFILDWARYPAVELLWKAGYSRLVIERIRQTYIAGAGAKARYAVRWAADDIDSALRFPRRLLNYKARADISVQDLLCVQSWLEKIESGDRVREVDVPELAAAKIYPEYIEDALPYATPHKIAKYLTSGDRQCVDYRDYLRECIKLKLDLSCKSVLFPRDLAAAHQRTIKLVKYEAEKINAEKFRRVVAELTKLAWSNAEMLIRPAQSAQELIDEGQALSHCVAGYADDMACGKTAIFFLRRKAEPDIPFYTLELRDKKVVQCRTKNNASYTLDENVKAFVKEWLAVVNKIAVRKHKKSKLA